MPENNMLDGLKFEFDFKLPRALVLAISLILIFLLLSLLFLPTKFPFSNDEAIYFEMIARFLQGQGFTSLLFRDFIPQLDQYSFWYPPVYFYLLSPLYLIFGKSILVGRLFSVACGSIALGLMYVFVLDQYKYRYSIIGVLALLVLDPYFQDGSIIARMEMLGIVFGLAAVIFHWRWLKMPNQASIFLSGVFSALSILTHPTGFILILPIGFSLLLHSHNSIQDRLKSWILFGVPIIVGVIFWFVSFAHQLDVFMIQNLVQIHRKNYIGYFILESIKYKPYHRILLLTYLFSNLFFVIRTFKFQFLKLPTQRFLLFLAASSLIFPILMKEMWYVVYLPLLGSIFLLHNLEWLWNRKIIYGVLVLFLLMATNLIIYLDTITQIVTKTQTYEQYGQIIANHIPGGEKVLLSILPDPYFYLHQHRPDLQLRESPNTPNNEPFDPDVYNTILNDVNYVVISIVPNDSLTKYYQENMEELIYSARSDKEYVLLILKLKPVADRVPVQVNKNMIWEYPNFDL